MKSGFTLIELVVGIFISGLIAVALYNSFYVTNRVVNSADDFISYDMRALLVQNQLERDLMGILIPENLPQPPESEIKTKDSGQIKTDQENKDSQENKKAQIKKEVAQEKTKKIEKIFYSNQKAPQGIELLTFITNNPIKTYDKATNSASKPALVRVVYRLVQDPEDPDSFILIRQESVDLNFDNFDSKKAKPVRAYALAQDIKSLIISYKFPLEKEKDSKEQAPPEYKTVSDWDSDSKKEEQKNQPQLPQFISIKLTLWDNQKKREQEYAFGLEVITFASLAKKETASKSSVTTKSKEETPSSNGGKPTGDNSRVS